MACSVLCFEPESQREGLSFDCVIQVDCTLFFDTLFLGWHGRGVEQKQV